MDFDEAMFGIRYITLGDCKATPTAIPAVNNMENTMNTTNTVDTHVKARYSLNLATMNTYYKVEKEALKTYGFIEHRKPKDAAELIEWIKSGDYEAPDTTDVDYDPCDYRYDSFLGITFPPKVKKDRDGFDKHMADFNKDKAAIDLEIAVLEPAEALKSYKTFERKWVR